MGVPIFILNSTHSEPHVLCQVIMILRSYQFPSDKRSNLFGFEIWFGQFYFMFWNTYIDKPSNIESLAVLTQSSKSSTGLFLIILCFLFYMYIYHRTSIYVRCLWKPGPKVRIKFYKSHHPWKLHDYKILIVIPRRYKVVPSHHVSGILWFRVLNGEI